MIISFTLIKTFFKIPYSPLIAALTLLAQLVNAVAASKFGSAAPFIKALNSVLISVTPVNTGATNE